MAVTAFNANTKKLSRESVKRLIELILLNDNDAAIGRRLKTGSMTLTVANGEVTQIDWTNSAEY
jgi:hypothetical protein